MSFREKSAWLMALLMAAAGLYYFQTVRAASQALGVTAPPVIVVAFIMVVVAGSIIGQVLLALSLRREASAPADERSGWCSSVLAAGPV